MTASADTRRVLIPVSPHRGAGAQAAAAATAARSVRRYRMGRMSPYTRPAAGGTDPDRFAQLRRGCD